MVDGKESVTEKKDVVKATTEKIAITGLNVYNLLNPAFTKKMEDEKLTVIPFLIGLDVNGETVTISHYNSAEKDKKIIHLECRNTPSKQLGKISKIIEGMVTIK